MGCCMKNVDIRIVENEIEMGKAGADIICGQIRTNPASVLGLATGSTPITTYQEIANRYKRAEVSFKEVISFNLDEYYPIKRSNPQSYYYFMQEHLFSHVDFKESSIHVPNGEAENVEEECAQYEKSIQQEGGIDLQLLGIGNNGHIGFNEPDDYLEPFTHLVDLAENTIEANARFFESAAAVPRKAITAGIRTIMLAKRILLLANGESKAAILDKSLFGPLSTQVPASLLQLHPNVTVIATKEAAKLLEPHLK